MPTKIEVNQGDRYSRLTIIREANKRRGMRYFLCQCDCGNISEHRFASIRSGSIKSCGCLRDEQNSTANKTHGLSKTPLYNTWHSMKQRCLNKQSAVYSYYGGRGITICDEWIGFKGFRNWAIRNGYKEGLTIERIDVNGNYEPSNCTWISKRKQSANTRRCRFYTFQGETKCIREWERYMGLNRGVLTRRLSSGWPIEKALTTPMNKSKQHERVA